MSLQRIPMDVMINHILPYTYQVQPNALLQDIKTCVNDFDLVENCYAFDYNYILLLRDLVTFCTNNKETFMNPSNTLIELVKRYVMYKDINQEQLVSKSRDLCYFCFVFLRHSSMNKKMERRLKMRIRFLWGLLIPEERTRFINKFILTFDE